MNVTKYGPNAARNNKYSKRMRTVKPPIVKVKKEKRTYNNPDPREVNY